MKDFTPTKRQEEILTLLYRFRFLDTRHFQKLLNHKHPQRVQVWLKSLHEESFIGRIYSNTFTENTKPAVYHLTPKGRKILKKKEGIDITILERVYREKNRSERLRQHCLLLADIYLDLLVLNKNSLHFFTKVDIVNYSNFPQPLPDAYIVIKDNRYFLEIIDEGIPRFAIRSMINKYIQHEQDGLWEENTDKPFPQVLIVSSNHKTKDWLKRYLKKKVDDEKLEISFFLALKDDIQKRGIRSDTWVGI